MVLAGGLDGIVGWKAKALGWNQELWREKATGITFPRPLSLLLGVIDHPTTETFAWVDGGASPHPVNATGPKATSPAITGC
jgi:hypothetical protein